MQYKNSIILNTPDKKKMKKNPGIYSRGRSCSFGSPSICQCRSPSRPFGCSGGGGGGARRGDFVFVLVIIILVVFVLLFRGAIHAGLVHGSGLRCCSCRRCGGCCGRYCGGRWRRLFGLSTPQLST